MDKEKIQKLKDYLENMPEINMAFIFGSIAKGKEISQSDIDVAIYFKPEGRELEWETQKEYKSEGKIWLEMERILERNTDLVILNRAPAGLAFEILRNGIPILIKERNLYLRFLLMVSQAAEDFREIAADWWKIKERSRSLSEEDKMRLMKTLDFLQKELEDIKKFYGIKKTEYEKDADKRRNLERWVENIVNASIDVAKIILASEKEPLPETYAQILSSLQRFEDFPAENAEILGEFAKIRNILAHEYLDLRYYKIKKFLDSAQKIYSNLIEFAKKRL